MKWKLNWRWKPTWSESSNDNGHDEDGGGHADQQVGHEEPGAVQDVTATIPEYSEDDISEVTSEDTTTGQTGVEQARAASSLSISLLPSPFPSPPPRGPGSRQSSQAYSLKGKQISLF